MSLLVETVMTQLQSGKTGAKRLALPVVLEKLDKNLMIMHG